MDFRAIFLFTVVGLYSALDHYGMSSTFVTMCRPAAQADILQATGFVDGKSYDRAVSFSFPTRTRLGTRVMVNLNRIHTTHIDEVARFYMTNEFKCRIDGTTMRGRPESEYDGIWVVWILAAALLVGITMTTDTFSSAISPIFNSTESDEPSESSPEEIAKVVWEKALAERKIAIQKAAIERARAQAWDDIMSAKK